jgi:hypothetical protein
MKTEYDQLISLGALVGLTGYVLSGPVGFMVVKSTYPQPVWASPAVFAENYHVIQDMPYYFGVLLIGGMLMLSAGIYLKSKTEPEKSRFHILLALMWTTFFAALIFFNYICQTTFVRHLALEYKPAYDAMISTFSMANPMSLCWAIEMWGYGILGVATWLMSAYYSDKNRAIYWLLILNGIVSILTVVFTIIDVNWLMTTAGLAGYFFWNVLMIVLMILIYKHSKKLNHENQQSMA